MGYLVMTGFKAWGWGWGWDWDWGARSFAKCGGTRYVILEEISRGYGMPGHDAINGLVDHVQCLMKAAWSVNLGSLS